jgi:hypothetical protein
VRRRRPGRRQQKRPVEFSTGRLVSCAVSGQLVLLARTSPVTARVGKAVIKEAAKVEAARGLGHADRIGPGATRRQARDSGRARGSNGQPQKEETSGCPLRPLQTAGSLRAMIQVRRVATQVRAAAERELAERSEALNCWLLVLHGTPPRYVCLWALARCSNGRLDRCPHDIAITVPPIGSEIAPCASPPAHSEATSTVHLA